MEQFYIQNFVTNGFIKQTLIYVISMEFLLLRCICFSQQNVPSSEEQGETAAFAGQLHYPDRRIGVFTLYLTGQTTNPLPG